MSNKRLINILSILLILVVIFVVFTEVSKQDKGKFPVPAPTGSHATAKAGPLKSYDTTDAYLDDMKLAPASCNFIVKDAESGLVLPDPKCSPGSINSNVTQENIDQTICKSGWTDTLRASSSVMSRAKKQSMDSYQIAEDRANGVSTYKVNGKTYTINFAKTKNTKKNGVVEFDHIVSLQLGGSNAASNLYPEPPKTGARGTTNTKDDVENKLNDAVCARKVSLAQAQSAIASDWTTALQVTGVAK